MRAKRKTITFTRAELVSQGREPASRKPMPKAAVTRKIHDAERAKAEAAEARRRRREERHAIQQILWRHNHYGIRVRATRATIGEIYNMARSSECLCTLRLGDPIVLPVDKVRAIAENPRTARAKTDEVYQVMKNEAKRTGAWIEGNQLRNADSRPGVRHPKWKEPKAK